MHTCRGTCMSVPHTPPLVLSSPATLPPTLHPALVPPGHWPAALGGAAAWLCRKHLAQGCENGHCSPLAFPYPPLSPRESCLEQAPTVAQPSAWHSQEWPDFRGVGGRRGNIRGLAGLRRIAAYCLIWTAFHSGLSEVTISHTGHLPEETTINNNPDRSTVL